MVMYSDTSCTFYTSHAAAMQDGGDVVQLATTVLTIVVVDVTDPAPSFSLSEYIFSVNEGQANVSLENIL